MATLDGKLKSTISRLLHGHIRVNMLSRGATGLGSYDFGAPISPVPSWPLTNSTLDGNLKSTFSRFLHGLERVNLTQFPIFGLTFTFGAPIADVMILVHLSHLCHNDPLLWTLWMENWNQPFPDYFMGIQGLIWWQGGPRGWIVMILVHLSYLCHNDPWP